MAGSHNNTKLATINHFLSRLITIFSSPIGLSAEQEVWLESVSYGNISTNWPLLSVNQSGYLMLNVQSFEQLTETANYPYHQAGVSCLHLFLFELNCLSTIHTRTHHTPHHTPHPTRMHTHTHAHAHTHTHFSLYPLQQM